MPRRQAARQPLQASYGLVQTFRDEVDQITAMVDGYFGSEGVPGAAGPEVRRFV